MDQMFPKLSGACYSKSSLFCMFSCCNKEWNNYEGNPFNSNNKFTFQRELSELWSVNDLMKHTHFSL
jgi:hypothetical protein